MNDLKARTWSKQDVKQEIEWLSYLATDLKEKLQRAVNDLQKSQKTNPTVPENIPLTLCNNLIEKVYAIQTSIQNLKQKLLPNHHAMETTDSISRDLFHIFSTLRELYGIAGSVITATDWQSPSYEHTGRFSMAGRLTGKIHATLNDYKRDQHMDAYLYEQRFLKEYIDAFNKFSVHVYACHSGMAAFTTILNFLLLETYRNGPVIMGSSTYFESKDLLQKAFRGHLIEISDRKTEEILLAIKKSQPEILFFDTIGNSPEMHAVDVRKILAYADKTLTHPSTIVIDNTGASVFCQPLSYIRRPLSKLTVIGYESLNKFHQFGMDKVLGGIIYTRGKYTDKLFDYRVHLGTNISDASVVSLPTPNRRVLTSRMMKIEKNTRIISEALQNAIKNNPKSPLDHIVYPGLPNHPSYTWIQKTSFSGAYFMLTFKKQYRSVTYYKRVVSKILTDARRMKVPLFGGTSFGFPVTRVYLTALRVKGTEEPFIRIAPGTENAYTISRIIDVFRHSFALDN